jgi:hypothetical protein
MSHILPLPLFENRKTIGGRKMTARNAISCSQGRHIIIVHADAKPSDSDWNSFLELIHTRGAHTHGLLSYSPTESGFPNRKQQLEFDEAWLALTSAGIGPQFSLPPIAFITNSSKMRGLHPKYVMRTFATSQWRDAMRYVNAKDQVATTIAVAISEFAEQLGVVPLLSC